VRRAAFASTCGFTEQLPIAYAHEELRWQAELQRNGAKIYFEPGAIVDHWNRAGFANLLRRNYRWAYSSIEAKAAAGAVRMARLYRYPRLLVAASLPLALAHSLYIVGCWLRAGDFEPLLMLPGVVAARSAYAVGMALGGIGWIRRGGTSASAPIRHGPASSAERSGR
jgi:hypothetical protein